MKLYNYTNMIPNMMFHAMMICTVNIQDADYNAVGTVTDKNKSAFKSVNDCCLQHDVPLYSSCSSLLIMEIPKCNASSTDLAFGGSKHKS